MKNIEEKILMAGEEIKQLQNKRKKLISQQKQEERKKRDRRLYEKGAAFESIFTESKDFTKDKVVVINNNITQHQSPSWLVLFSWGKWRWRDVSCVGCFSEGSQE